MLDKTVPKQNELDEDACWSAVLRREENQERAFVFGVITTGIFCRPSCPARRPRRENVRFFHDAAAAQGAGFRACLRCSPLGIAPAAQHRAAIAGVCRQIEAAGEMPSLGDLAREAGFSPFYFHRLFKRIMGLTPKAYMAGVRAQQMRERLSRGGGSVTEAIYEAGFSSSSRFYEKAEGMLGMSPRRYQSGGRGIRMGYVIERCWLGFVLVAATERGICAILFGDGEDELAPELTRRFPMAEIAPAGAAFAERLAKALEAIEKPRLASGLPIDVLGTAFQQRIWTALREIPAGETATYAEVAQRVGAPRAVRAVAAACAANHLAVAVPCHRVIRGDGQLAGYRWGLKRKRELLAREATDEAEPRKRQGHAVKDRRS